MKIESWATPVNLCRRAGIIDRFPVLSDRPWCNIVTAY
jgi:hypothetical protein